MRKRIVNQNTQQTPSTGQSWLDLQHLAQVELSSEDAGYPIEAALIPGYGSGWRAAQAGEQSIRILFDKVQKVARIQLLIDENQRGRTQEFVLLWMADAGQPYREIVRQQYNFSPPGMIREFEDYTVDLVGVMAMELRIIPNINGGDARASITQLRIA